MLIFRNVGIWNSKANSIALIPNEETAGHEEFQTASVFFLFINFPSILQRNEESRFQNHRKIKVRKDLQNHGDQTLPCQLNYSTKWHIQSFLEYIQGWWCHQFHGQFIPMLDHSFSVEIPPDGQPKPSPVQLQAISSHSVISCLGGEVDPHCLQPPFR